MTAEDLNNADDHPGVVGGRLGMDFAAIQAHMLHERNAYRQLCTNLETDIMRVDGKVQTQKELNEKISNGEVLQRLVDIGVMIQAIRKTILNCKLLPKVKHLQTDFQIFETGEELEWLAEKADDYMDEIDDEHEDDPVVAAPNNRVSLAHGGNSRPAGGRFSIMGNTSGAGCPNKARGGSVMHRQSIMGLGHSGGGHIPSTFQQTAKKSKHGIPTNLDWDMVGVPALGKAMALSDMTICREQNLENAYHSLQTKFEWNKDNVLVEKQNFWDRLQVRQIVRYLERLAEPDRDCQKLEQRLLNLKSQTEMFQGEASTKEAQKLQDEFDVQRALAVAREKRDSLAKGIVPMSDDDSEGGVAEADDLDDELDEEEEFEEEDDVESDEI